MTFLARWLQFLRFLEGLLEFLDFLTTPLGIVASVGLGLYSLLVLLASMPPPLRPSPVPSPWASAA